MYTLCIVLPNHLMPLEEQCLCLLFMLYTHMLPKNKSLLARGWEFMPIISALGKLRQEDHRNLRPGWCAQWVETANVLRESLTQNRRLRIKHFPSKHKNLSLILRTHVEMQDMVGACWKDSAGEARREGPLAVAGSVSWEVDSIEDHTSVCPPMGPMGACMLMHTN